MGQIVNFPVRVPEADEFVHEELARLFGIWRQQLRITSTLPRLHAFAPRHLGALMRFSAIVELREEHEMSVMASLFPPSGLGSADRLFWRLAGSGLCQLAGGELAGRAVFDDWQRFERATLRRLLHQALTAAQPFMARLRLYALAAAHVNEHMEMLALPLADTSLGDNVVLLVFRTTIDTQMVMQDAFSSSRLLSLRTLTSASIGKQTAAHLGESSHPATILHLHRQLPAREQAAAIPDTTRHP